MAKVLFSTTDPKFFHRAETESPVVTDYRCGSLVLSNASTIPLNSWLIIDRHIVVVTAHERNQARAEVIFEKHGTTWGNNRLPVRIGSRAAYLTPQIWAEILTSKFPNYIQTGFIRQYSIEEIPALFPTLEDWRAIVLGTSGAGKSTALIALGTAWRKKIRSSQYLPTQTIPGMVCLDLHRDFQGGNLDRHTQKLRPNFVSCLPETVKIFTKGDLYCRVSDIPATLLVKCLGKLTAAQQRWCKIYIIQDTDHEPIRKLVKKPEPDSTVTEEWVQAFPDLAKDNVLPKSAIDMLTTLKAQFLALLSKPLFQKDGESTWENFIKIVRSGTPVVIDVKAYPPMQQALLVYVVLTTLKNEQESAAERGEKLQPILILGDETHKLPQAAPAFEMIFRETRKLSISAIFGSQSFEDFPKACRNMLTHALIFKSEGSDSDALIRRWEKLKAYRQQLSTFAPGEGFFIHEGIPIPIKIEEPPLLNNRS